MRRLFLPPAGAGNHAIRSNFIANIFDGGFYALAMSFVSQQTVLPVFVKRMGGSNVHVGLLPVLWTFGFNFPGIFIANIIQHYPRKREVFLKTAFFQRLTWMLLGAFSFILLERTGSGVVLLLFFVLYALAAVSGSINLPIWFDLIAKVTPIEYRGRLFAARNVLGGLFGVLGGWIVVWILGAIHYPMNFSLLFLLAVIASLMSYWFLTRLKEETDSSPREKVEMLQYFRGLPEILRANKNFRNFLISDALLIAATMGGAFYAVNAIERFSLPDASVGTFTVVMMTATIIGNLFFGYVADHRGHKLNLVLSGTVSALAAFVALFAPSEGVYLIAFVGAALTTALSGVSRLSIVAELCPEGERLTYVALANMITAPFVLCGLFGGWIANNFGFDAVFCIAGCFAAASAIWLGLKVKEPRKKIARQPILQEVQYQA